MKHKLFENAGGNKFLLNENINMNETLVASGVKKVFMNAGTAPISYNRIEAVGMGYIKDINTAKRVALEEARILAKEYGFSENFDEAKFVKENDFSKLDAQNPSHAMAKIGSDEVGSNETDHGETDMNNQEEKREVEIGREIIQKTQILVNKISEDDWEKYVTPIQALAKELIQMHGQQAE